MDKTRTTTRLLAGLIIAAALVSGTGGSWAGAADASHVDRGHALGGRRGVIPRHPHQCRPQTPFAPAWVACGVRGVVGGARPIPLVRLAARRQLWTHPASKGVQVSARIVSAPRQKQDLHAFIEPLSPHPDQVVAVGSPQAYIAARVAANAAITRVELRLDNVVVRPEILGRDDTEASLLYQPRRWRVGWHSVRVRVWDAAGQVSECAWTFRMTR